MLIDTFLGLYLAAGLSAAARSSGKLADAFYRQLVFIGVWLLLMLATAK